MPESQFGLIGQLVGGLLTVVWQFISTLLPLLLPWLPGGLWCAWWLWGVNWKHAWPVLTRGGWVPVVLLTFLSALVWSYLSPSSCGCLRFMEIPNFWWQLGSVASLVGVALVCGWVQGQLHWTPEDVSFEPTAGGHGGQGHGHH